MVCWAEAEQIPGVISCWERSCFSSFWFAIGKTPTSDDVDCSQVLPVMLIHPQPGVHAEEKKKCIKDFLLSRLSSYSKRRVLSCLHSRRMKWDFHSLHSYWLLQKGLHLHKIKPFLKSLDTPSHMSTVAISHLKWIDEVPLEVAAYVDGLFT